METNTKIKTGIAAIVIIAITIFAINFYLKTKTSEQSENQIQQAQTKTKEKKQENVPVINLEGAISKIDPSSIEIKNGDITNSLSLVNDVLVFQLNDLQAEKKELSNLKEGTSVRVQIRQADSMVVSVEILK